MHVLRAVFATAVVLIVPVAAMAQASIVGVVRDASGAVLPGVTVEAASPALIEKTRSVVTDSGGQYRIVDLRPGEYVMTVSLAGFSTVRREGIELSGSATATINIEMRIGAVTETITVTGATPVVDVQGVQQQRVLSKEVIDTLPTGRTTLNVAALIPGMQLSTTFSGEGQDVGGNTGEVQQTLSIHGSRGNDMRRMLDGLSMQSQGTSVSAFAPNGALVQEVVVDIAAGSAEQSAGGVRMNIVPREGGNNFTGTFFATGTNDSLQSDNIDQELRDRGIISASAVKSNWEVNPAFGGPVKRDRLWFFVTARQSEVSNYIGGALRNANAGDPNSFAYAPDPSFRGSRDTTWTNGNGRLTWQAAPKHKLSFFVDGQHRCSCVDTRALTSPEASANFEFPWKPLVTVSYTSPISSRILIEAGYAYKPEDWGYFEPTGGNDAAALIGINDQASGVFYRGPRAMFGSSMRFRAELLDNSWRGSLSYITGAHAFKVGYQDHTGSAVNHFNQPVAANLSYLFSAGAPVQLTQRAPYDAETHVHDGGIYAQDRWTIQRVTLNLGVRYDFYRTDYPAQSLGPTVYTPSRNVTFQAGEIASFRDVTPKLGVVYDLFGNGRTALKASLAKYVEQLTYTGTYGDSANPVNRTVQSVNRSWPDANRDFIPQCDLLNPLLNGECGQISNLAFGNPIPSTAYDPDILTGWGKRGFNWESSVAVQQELSRRVSLDVGYFRRWYGNFLATDNRAVSAGDFDQFSVVAPKDPRLPEGGAQTIPGLVNVTPTKFGQTINLLTFADAYGKQAENWQGVDVSVNARLTGGVLAQGGISTGRRLTDNCEIVAAVPELFVAPTGLITPQSYCRVEEPYLTQLKLVGAYIIPRIDVQFAATFQSIPGPVVQANTVYSSAVIATSLGRPLSGNVATAQVNVIAPATEYGDRLNQLDFRVGKILKFGRTRTALNVDIFNALNDNAVLTENPSYAVFRQPLSVLNPRLVKFSVNLNF
jgi:Carboxypeptidase regulatory-like domain